MTSAYRNKTFTEEAIGVSGIAVLNNFSCDISVIFQISNCGIAVFSEPAGCGLLASSVGGAKIILCTAPEMVPELDRPENENQVWILVSWNFFYFYFC